MGTSHGGFHRGNADQQHLAGIRSIRVSAFWCEFVQFASQPFGVNSRNPRLTCWAGIHVIRSFRAIRVSHHDSGRGGLLNQSFGDGVARQTGNIVDIELVHDLLPVFLDRLDADG
jgi:hypothetical protein